MENEGILYVFQVFRTEGLAEKIRCPPQMIDSEFPLFHSSTLCLTQAQIARDQLQPGAFFPRIDLRLCRQRRAGRALSAQVLRQEAERRNAHSERIIAQLRAVANQKNRFFKIF